MPLNRIPTSMVDGLDEQLAAIESVKIYMILQGFKFDGSDETATFQNLMNQYSGQRVVCVFPQGKTIALNNVILPNMTLVIEGNFCTFTGNVTNFLFKNTTNTSAILIAKNMTLSVIGLVDFELDGTASAGTKIWVDNIIATGNAQQGSFIKCRSNDFMNAKNIYLYSYDKVFDIESNVTGTPKDRMNTQIHIENVNVHNVNYGFYGKGISKLTIIGMDVQGCTTGIYFNTWVDTVRIINYHVEYYGNYSASGYAVQFDNYATVTDVIFSECDFKSPATNAQNAIYMPPITTATASGILRVTFENCTVDTISGKQALYLNGQFRWIGSFNFTNTDVSLYQNGYNQVLQGVITPTDNYYTGRNLLPVNKPISLSDFTYNPTSASGSATTVMTNDQLIITNGTSSTLQYGWTLTPTQLGWYTLLFNGDLVNSANKIAVGQTVSPYTNFLSSSVIATYSYQTNRAYLYVSDITKTISIQFNIAAGQSIKLGDVGFYKGFKTEF